MKKLYLTAAALLACTMINAQAFWTYTSYKGAFPVTDNSAATDWTDGWANFDPENTSYGNTSATVSSDITSNTTWSGIVLLQNKIYVKNGAVLTIQPGTVIRGDKTSQGSLIITRGSKIIAQGTAQNPIVFTSNEAVGNRAEGDWGGLVILGNAKNNQPGGVANIEGINPIPETQFGGNDDNDNSGVLSYIRIEFAGIALQPNKEINGLTFGSVGKQTQVDHIQVSFSGDDSFEWFGGTVDARYLISYRGLDDDFDTDFGYRGRVQFGLIIRDKDLSDAAGDSNAWESDNDATGSTAKPLTQAIFSNITVIGPKGNGSIALPTGEKFEKSFRIRRNSALSICNSITTGWEKGLSIEGSATEDNFTGDSAYFMGNILAGYNSGANIVTAPLTFYATFFGTDGNDSTTTTGQINWVSAFPALGNKPDMRLSANSAAATGAMFPPALFGSDFVGVEEHRNPGATLSVYPNPSTETSAVRFVSASGQYAEIRVTDLSGRTAIVMNENAVTGANLYTLNTQHLEAGIYFVSVTSGVSKETVKLLVRH